MIGDDDAVALGQILESVDFGNRTSQDKYGFGGVGCDFCSSSCARYNKADKYAKERDEHEKQPRIQPVNDIQKASNGARSQTVHRCFQPLAAAMWFLESAVT